MPKISPLAEHHRKKNAEFAEEDGWLIALHFGDPVHEYRAVRSQVGLLDLCHHSHLRLTGPDRVSYLQGMVTNDVKALTPGSGVYAALLDVNGKILADLRVFCTEDSFSVELLEPLKEKALAHLNRYLIADDVEISDLTGLYGMISLQGPKARPLLRDIVASEQIPPLMNSHGALQIADREARIVRSTHTGEEGFDLIIPIQDLTPVIESIEKAGKVFSLCWVGARAQEMLRVEAGIPRYGIDMDEDNLLLETGLDQAVSFEKGCYLGQEVVERIHSRGHVNRKLAGMVLEGKTAASRGDKITSGEKEIGRVTSSIFSPHSKSPIALGYVHRDYLQPGTRVFIERDGELVPGMISSVPFYRSSS
jgi:glycine cleavage system T protein